MAKEVEKRKYWESEKHETKVENFYSSGIKGYHNYHDGYLNFGYWTRPNMTYEEAAENLVQTMGNLLGLNNESILLDVGPGMGTQDIYLTKNFNPKKIEALDVTWKHIEIAKERQKKENVSEEKLKFNHGTAIDLPFENKSFTHILSIEAPEHFDTREIFLKDAYRVLKPGGVIAMCDYSLNRQPKNIFEKLIVYATAKIWHVPKENIYGNTEYVEKMKKIGFNNITIENIGRNVIPGYYFEHRRPESVRAMRKLRGFWKGIIGGFLIDYGVYLAFKKELLEYILVRAQKRSISN